VGWVSTPKLITRNINHMMDDYEDGCSTYIYSLRSNWEKLKQNSRHLENVFVFIFRFHPLIFDFPAGNKFFFYGLNYAWLKIYVWDYQS
jgi:hypothetical protein